jgi:high-affinity iron transporter
MTLLLTCALISGPSYAADTTELKAKQIWQLLDYVAVDYGGAVANGTVLKASEYAEMQEFLRQPNVNWENCLTR